MPDMATQSSSKEGIPGLRRGDVRPIGLIGRLVGWSVGQLVGWSVGQLVGWSVGRLVGWEGFGVACLRPGAASKPRADDGREVACACGDCAARKLVPRSAANGTRWPLAGRPSMVTRRQSLGHSPLVTRHRSLATSHSPLVTREFLTGWRTAWRRRRGTVGRRAIRRDWLRAS